MCKSLADGGARCLSSTTRSISGSLNSAYASALRVSDEQRRAATSGFTPDLAAVDSAFSACHDALDAAAADGTDPMVARCARIALKAAHADVHTSLRGARLRVLLEQGGDGRESIVKQVQENKAARSTVAALRAKADRDLTVALARVRASDHVLTPA
jgi:hypothetical protein